MTNKEITLEDIEKEIEVFESKECNNQNNLFMEGYRYCFDRFFKLIEQWGNKNKQLEQENQQLKKQYCERTDCSGRIKDSKKYDSLQQRIDKAIEEIDKYLLTEDYCSLKCENLADTFYKLSEILKGKSE